MPGFPAFARAIPLAWMVLLVAGWSASSEAPSRFDLDWERSHLVLRTYRGGLLSFLGHDHGVLATAWTAEACVDPSDLSASSLSIVLPVDSLVIDSPEARKLAGLDPGGGPVPAERTDLQRKMLGPEVLDAGRHPEIRFRSRGVEPSSRDELMVTGELRIRGVTREVAVPVSLNTTDDGALELAGRAEIRHTWFGMKPESVLGVVNVKDEMDLLVRLVGRTTGRPCRQAG